MISENCAYCGDMTDMPFHCSYCKDPFCAEHRLPEEHRCVKPVSYTHLTLPTTPYV